MRFHEAGAYSGHVCPELPSKIQSFEQLYDVKVESWLSFICAPPENFVLTKVEDDPLFFYKINAEYFFLIHKWGDDLSPMRAIKVVAKNALAALVFAVIILSPFISALVGWLCFGLKGFEDISNYFLLGFLPSGSLIGIAYIILIDDTKGASLKRILKVIGAR